MRSTPELRYNASQVRYVFRTSQTVFPSTVVRYIFTYLVLSLFNDAAALWLRMAVSKKPVSPPAPPPPACFVGLFHWRQVSVARTIESRAGRHLCRSPIEPDPTQPNPASTFCCAAVLVPLLMTNTKVVFF